MMMIILMMVMFSSADAYDGILHTPKNEALHISRDSSFPDEQGWKATVFRVRTELLFWAWRWLVALSYKNISQQNSTLSNMKLHLLTYSSQLRTKRNTLETLPIVRYQSVTELQACLEGQLPQNVFSISYCLDITRTKTRPTTNQSSHKANKFVTRKWVYFD